MLGCLGGLCGSALGGALVFRLGQIGLHFHMSTSTLHHHFRALTAMSPLQYQKTLRLHEARRLMLFQKTDASDACHRVGYVSASQFSREYARFFGSAPGRDIARLRDAGFAPYVNDAPRQGCQGDEPRGFVWHPSRGASNRRIAVRGAPRFASRPPATF